MNALPTNVHPGEVLWLDFMEPAGISQNALARALGVPPARVNKIVLGQRNITPDTAVRLSAFFGTSAQFWLGMQADHDLEQASLAIGADIERTRRVAAGMRVRARRVRVAPGGREQRVFAKAA